MRVFRDRVLPLVARLLISTIFVNSAISKYFGWEENVQYMTSKHLTHVTILLAAALVVEALGSLSLVVGFGARIAASVMFLYLIPVTVLLHDFMSTQFEKNLGIMGGLLMIAAYGPGSWSLSPRDGHPHSVGS
jgi:putative oxidoreductase